MPAIERIIREPRFWLALFITGSLLILYLSLIKAPTIRIGPDVRNRTAHFAAYMVYGIASTMWRITASRRQSATRLYLEGVLPCAAFGTIMEWLQIYLPNRDSDPYDWVCNVLGALAGAALALLAAIWKLRRNDS